MDLDGGEEEGKEDEGDEAEGEGPQEEEGEQNLPGQVEFLFLFACWVRGKYRIRERRGGGY